MIIRLLKVLSMPVFVVSIIPISLITAIWWIVTGNDSPMELLGYYFTWLGDD